MPMPFIKILLIFLCLFICRTASAGFLIAAHRPQLALHYSISDTAAHLGGFYRWHKVKEVKKSRAVLYAVLGLLPPAYIFSPGIARWYLGYKRNYGFTIGAVLFLAFALWLLFSPSALAGLAFLIYFGIWRFIVASADLVKICFNKVKPVNGRFYAKKQQA